MPQRIQVAECIQQAQLIGRFKQRLAFALSMDINEKLTQAAQGRDRHGLVVDIGEAAAGLVQAPREDDLILIQLAVQRSLYLGAQPGSHELKAPGDAQLGGSIAQ